MCVGVSMQGIRTETKIWQKRNWIFYVKCLCMGQQSNRKHWMKRKTSTHTNRLAESLLLYSSFIFAATQYYFTIVIVFPLSRRRWCGGSCFMVHGGTLFKENHFAVYNLVMHSSVCALVKHVDDRNATQENCTGLLLQMILGLASDMDPNQHRESQVSLTISHKASYKWWIQNRKHSEKV